MAFLFFAICSLLSQSAFTLSNSITERATPSTIPFDFIYAFSAHLTLEKPLPRIAIPGGVIVPEPISNGTVSGPAINATITGGIATPAVYENGTLQVPVIQAWGTTSDGSGFVINELGVATPKGQVTRIQINIGEGSKYASLRDSFVLATVNPNADQTEVAVQGYLIENTAKFLKK